MKTNYGLRPVKGAELVEAFGTAEAALRATGGDEPTALFYLNNPERIAAAPASGVVRDTALAVELRRLAQVAIDAQNVRAAKAAWGDMEKPTVTAVAESLGVCWKTAKRRLVAARVALS